MSRVLRNCSTPPRLVERLRIASVLIQMQCHAEAAIRRKTFPNFSWPLGIELRFRTKLRSFSSRLFFSRSSLAAWGLAVSGLLGWLPEMIFPQSHSYNDAPKKRGLPWTTSRIVAFPIPVTRTESSSMPTGRLRMVIVCCPSSKSTWILLWIYEWGHRQMIYNFA